MNLHSHSSLVGKHSFLSPSSGHWVNYDEDKLTRVFYTHQSAIRGTELHALAHDLIRLGVRLPDNGTTLSMYVNDAIGFDMTPELILFYSDNCFGQADACSFRGNRLRIHDLKTGVTEAKELQLDIYVALFCLEYRLKPQDIEIECRIYQNDEIRIWVPAVNDIFHIMDRIVTFDKHINELKKEAL